VVDPIDVLISGQAPTKEHNVHDLVRAIEAAAGDERIKAVVLDLTRFIGGGQVHMQALGEAMDRVRKAEKPVLTYSLGYGDDHMHLAAHASEVWVDPMGGALIAGPGGTNLYYGDLLDRLNINARIYKVGTYKAATEPYSDNSMSDAARQNIGAVYAALWEEWQANVAKARPGLEIDRVISDPVAWVQASQGDLAEAALDAGLVDKLGSRVEFGARVAELAGEDAWSDAPGAYAKTELEPYLADTIPSSDGRAIGVVTVAGTIVDGEAGPGTAGGDRIAEILDNALDDDLAGLVIRVDSPGGSAIASEVIRRAIGRHQANDIPVAVSFANVAASGGYWVATSADRIFAQPETVTGSIGVFAVIPTFEGLAAEIGVNADGIRTTPLSGQPDLIDGFTPELDAILQSGVEDSYRDFMTIVGEGRGKTLDQVDAIGQGQVWDGGTARQNGLVDQFGGLEEALNWVAEQASLGEGEWHAKFLGRQMDSYDSLIRQLVMGSESDARQRGDLFGLVAQQQRGLSARLMADVQLLTGTPGVQAYCADCPVEPRAATADSSAGPLINAMRSLFGR
jgi:protease-4